MSHQKIKVAYAVPKHAGEAFSYFIVLGSDSIGGSESG